MVLRSRGGVLGLDLVVDEEAKLMENKRFDGGRKEATSEGAGAAAALHMPQAILLSSPLRINWGFGFSISSVSKGLSAHS